MTGLRRQSDAAPRDPCRQAAVRARAYELFVMIGRDAARADECWRQAIDDAEVCSTDAPDMSRVRPPSAA